MFVLIRHFQSLTDTLALKYLFKVFSSFVSGLNSLLILSKIPKVVGPEQFGVYHYLFSSLTNLFTIIESGTTNAFYTALCGEKNQTGILRLYIPVFTIIISLVSIVTLTPKLVLGKSGFLSEFKLELILVALALSISTWVFQIGQKVTDALGLTVQVELRLIVSNILGIGSLAYFIYLNQITLKSFFLALIWISLLRNIAILHALFFSYKHKSAKLLRKTTQIKKKYTYKNMINFSKPMFLYLLISAGLPIAEKTILQIFGGAKEQGFFAVGSHISTICTIATGAALPLIHRKLSFLNKLKSDSKTTFNYFFHLAPIFLIISCLLSFSTTANIHFINSNIMGTSFLEAKSTLIMMLLTPIHQTYGQIVGTLFYSFGLTKEFSKIGITFNLLGFLLTCLLVLPKSVYGLGLGALGLSIKIAIIQFFTVNFSLYIISRIQGWCFKKIIVQQAFIISFTFIISVASKNLISFFYPKEGFTYLILQVCLSLLFLYLLFIQKNKWICKNVLDKRLFYELVATRE